MGEALRLDLKVSPGASRNEVKGWMGEVLKVSVTAAPEKGKANAAVIKLLSRALRIAPSSIEVSRGHGNSKKQVLVHGVSRAQLLGVFPQADQAPDC